MWVLRPDKKVRKTVCPECEARGEVIDSCSTCHGTAVKKHEIFQFCVQESPITITNVDRDPRTGILRYWEDGSSYFHETTDSTLNKYMPDVPYGIHLCHYGYDEAVIECERINNFLAKQKVEV